VLPRIGLNDAGTLLGPAALRLADRGVAAENFAWIGIAGVAAGGFEGATSGMNLSYICAAGRDRILEHQPRQFRRGAASLARELDHAGPLLIRDPDRHSLQPVAHRRRLLSGCEDA
jgi:hypothetical protein